jgi:hypothetical protein
MQEGAGVGRKKSDARIPSVQRGLSASATLPVLNGFDQDPADIRRCFLAFLPGSGLQVECDVTYSKQTTAPLLPGSRIAQHGLPQSTAFCAELRSAAVPNASQSSGVSTLVAEATPEVRCHARTSITSALSNRELQLLERTLTHRKQTIAPHSNRELLTNRCFGNSHSVNPIPSFLPGSGLQVEWAVTHSKQTTEPFLPGSRIVTKRLVSRTIFHPVSFELFPAHRRISLQDGIAHNMLVTASPRMHALVGRL